MTTSVIDFRQYVAAIIDDETALPYLRFVKEARGLIVYSRTVLEAEG